MDGGERVHAFADTPEGLDAIHHAAEHFNADPDYVPGTGAFIGTSLDTGSDAEQRADAQRAYQKENNAAQAAPGMADRVRDVWQDAQHHWRTTAGDEKAAASR